MTVHLWTPQDITPRAESNFRWGTVATVVPLTVRLDGDSQPLDAIPDTLEDPGNLKPGDRVWVQLYNRRIIVLGRSGSTFTGGAKTMQLLQAVMSGGGVRKVDSVGVSWSQRFILMGAGASDLVPQGFFDVSMPPDGTVIPVHSSSAETVTVASGKIPLINWQALYYEVPLGQNSYSAPGNFHIVYYFGGDDFQIPPNWVFICVRNGDSYAPAYKWGDGRMQDFWKTLTMANGWVAYGSGWPVPTWRWMPDGRVLLRGLMKSGTVGATTPAITIDTALAPEGAGAQGLIFNQLSSVGQARVDVHSTGNICVVATYNGGSTSFVTLDNMSWFPAGA